MNFGSTGGLGNVLAVDGSGREVRATALEDARLFQQYVNLARYNKAGNVVLNFPLVTGPPPPPAVTIQLFQKDSGGVEREIPNGFVEVGKDVALRVGFTEPPGSASRSVNSVPRDMAQIDELHFEATFLTPETRS